MQQIFYSQDICNLLFLKKSPICRYTLICHTSGSNNFLTVRRNHLFRVSQCAGGQVELPFHILQTFKVIFRQNTEGPDYRKDNSGTEYQGNFSAKEYVILSFENKHTSRSFSIHYWGNISRHLRDFQDHTASMITHLVNVTQRR